MKKSEFEIVGEIRKRTKEKEANRISPHPVKKQSAEELGNRAVLPPPTDLPFFASLSQRKPPPPNILTSNFKQTTHKVAERSLVDKGVSSASSYTRCKRATDKAQRGTPWIHYCSQLCTWSAKDPVFSFLI